VSDVFTIIRKEIAEVFGDWHSFYGVAIQTAVVVITCGILVPGDDTTVWLSPGRLILLYAMFPSVIAATFSADAFAGERERRTLPTLLATPISDGAIFLGKISTAVGISVACSLLAISAGVTTTLVKGEDPLPVMGVHGFATLLGGAFAFALVTTAIATTVSSRVRVARSAQQISSMTTIMLSFLVGFVMKQADIPPTWTSILVIDGLLFTLGVLFLTVGLRAFGRGRAIT
jgi:ABC-2 type transport system permease protein